MASRLQELIYARNAAANAEDNLKALLGFDALDDPEIVLFIDSDMVLEPNVLAEIATTFAAQPETGAVIIPERSFGVGFLASCRVLEKSLYVGQDDVEAPRAFRRELFDLVGRWDETLTGFKWIANRAIERGQPVLFIVVPDLLDYLRATFGPNSTASYDERFDKVRNAPLLILDDLGTQSSTSWAQEKLYQILNHRYNARLPTVITTATPIDDLDPRSPPLQLRHVPVHRIKPLVVPARRRAHHLPVHHQIHARLVRVPAAAHQLAHVINVALGNVGHTVTYLPVDAPDPHLAAGRLLGADQEPSLRRHTCSRHNRAAGRRAQRLSLASRREQ